MYVINLWLKNYKTKPVVNWVNGENVQLKNIRCRQYRNDPLIRNIATETNHTVSKYFSTWAQTTANDIYTGQRM